MSEMWQGELLALQSLEIKHLMSKTGGTLSLAELKLGKVMY